MTITVKSETEAIKAWKEVRDSGYKGDITIIVKYRDANGYYCTDVYKN